MVLPLGDADHQMVGLWTARLACCLSCDGTLVIRAHPRNEQHTHHYVSNTATHQGQLRVNAKREGHPSEDWHVNERILTYPLL